jgi:hypothetical protein
VIASLAALVLLVEPPVRPDPAGPGEARTRDLGEAIAVPEGGDCLDTGALATAAAGWLDGREVDARLSIEAYEDSEGIGLRLFDGPTLRVERRLSPAPARCEDRRAALGLAIALAIDAAVLEGLAPAQPEPEAEPLPEPVAPAPAIAPTPEIASADAPQPRIGGALHAEGLAAFGVLPSPAFGAAVEGELLPVPWLAIDAGTFVLAGLPFALADGTIDAVLAAGSVRVCPRRGFGRVHISLCGGAAAGAVIARGDGFFESRTPVLPWVALRFGGDLEVRLVRRVGLRLGADALTPLVRASFDVRDAAGRVVAARTVAPAGALVRLGVAFRF